MTPPHDSFVLGLIEHHPEILWNQMLYSVWGLLYSLAPFATVPLEQCTCLSRLYGPATLLQRRVSIYNLKGPKEISGIAVVMSICSLIARLGSELLQMLKGD